MRKSILIVVLAVLVELFLTLLLLATDTGQWIRKHDTPVSLTEQPWRPNSPWGQAMVGTGDSLYVIAEQGGVRYFWKYNPTRDDWESLTTFPNDVKLKNGTSLAWDYERYIYALFGGAYGDDEPRRYFFRFDTQNRSWDRLADTPYQQGAGDAITFVDYNGQRHIYAFVGQSENQPYTHFLRYDISLDQWQLLDCPPPFGRPAEAIVRLMMEPRSYGPVEDTSMLCEANTTR